MIGVLTISRTASNPSMKFAFSLLAIPLACAQSWIPQTSGTTASFRGIHAVDSQTVWVSGTTGSYVTTTDGGVTWRAAQVPGAEKLDFRAIWAFDANNAFLLSIGNGDQSRVYQTTDRGAHWKLIFTNPDAKGFFDGLAFWDRNHGVIAGDAVDGRTVVFTTSDGGATWQRQSSPEAIGSEGAFAASNSSLALWGVHDVWLGTTAARVLHSGDNGRTWSAAGTPIRHDGTGAGIFSVAFANALFGVAVGGDYTKSAESRANIAVTSDGGATWTAPAGTPPAGFRSAVTWLPGTTTWVATGTSGSDISTDNGIHWKQFDSGGYNAFAFVSSSTGWAVGPRGRIAKWSAGSASVR
jgi:photosystem II stability/assembly factor-like uncharacterized protein